MQPLHRSCCAVILAVALLDDLNRVAIAGRGIHAFCCCGIGTTWNGQECVPCRAAAVLNAGELCSEECAGTSLGATCDFCGPAGKCCRRRASRQVQASAARRLEHRAHHYASQANKDSNDQSGSEDDEFMARTTTPGTAEGDEHASQSHKDQRDRHDGRDGKFTSRAAKTKLHHRESDEGDSEEDDESDQADRHARHNSTTSTVEALDDEGDSHGASHTRNHSGQSASTTAANRNEAEVDNLTVASNSSPETPFPDNDTCSEHEGGLDQYICVGSTPPGLQHEGVDCLLHCGRRSGACKFCGMHGRCCRQGWRDQEGDTGDGSCAEDEGGIQQHICIGPPGHSYSCDAPEVIFDSKDWWTCAGSSFPCNIRDGHEGCCCESGYEPIPPERQHHGLCAKFGNASCALDETGKCVSMPALFVEGSETDHQCHPSAHTFPCDREGTQPGPPVWNLIWCLACASLCCCFGIVGVGVVKKMRARDPMNRLRRINFKQGDRVVCTGTAHGRFEKGDVGTVDSMDGPKIFVQLDKYDRAISIGAFCLEHADGIEWEVREPHLAKSAKKVVLPAGVKRGEALEALLQELFRLQDLKGNAVLEEGELVKINEKIDMLHYGKDSERKQQVKEKFLNIFRTHLNPHGQAVTYPAFREYMVHYLDELDPDPRAQEMILEQFVAEAASAREAFYWPSMMSESDAPFLPKLSERQMHSMDERRLKAAQE